MLNCISALAAHHIWNMCGVCVCVGDVVNEPMWVKQIYRACGVLLLLLLSFVGECAVRGQITSRVQNSRWEAYDRRQTHQDCLEWSVAWCLCVCVSEWCSTTECCVIIIHKIAESRTHNCREPTESTNAILEPTQDGSRRREHRIYIYI